MGHNRSLTRERDEAMCSPVSDWADCYLVVRCAARQCVVTHHLPLWNMERLHGDLPLGRFINRLRCSGCHQPPRDVALRRPRVPRELGKNDSWLALRGRGAEMR